MRINLLIVTGFAGAALGVFPLLAEGESPSWKLEACQTDTLQLSQNIVEVPKSCQQAAEKGESVLGNFAMGAFQYQLAVSPDCVQKKQEEYQWEECPIFVNLLKNGKLADKQTLPKATIKQEDNLYRWYLEKTLEGYNWRILQSETSELSNFVQFVHLDASHSGFLVTQNTSSEYGDSHTDYVLYIIEKNKLKKIWSFSDISPYSFSSFRTTEHAGKNYFLLWTGVSHLGLLEAGRTPESYDSFQPLLLYWQTDKKEVKTISLPTKGMPLYLVVGDFYPGAARAWEAISSALRSEMKCPGFLYVLATTDYPQLVRQEKAFRGNVFFTLEEAQKLQKELRECKPAIDSELILLN